MADQGDAHSLDLLDMHIYNYLVRKNLHQTAEMFAAESNLDLNFPGGQPTDDFLSDWWLIFWDVFKARFENNPATTQGPVANPNAIRNPIPIVNPRPVANPSLMANPNPRVNPIPMVNPNLRVNPFSMVNQSPMVNPSHMANPIPNANPSPMANPIPIANPSPMAYPTPMANPTPMGNQNSMATRTMDPTQKFRIPASRQPNGHNVLNVPYNNGSSGSPSTYLRPSSSSGRASRLSGQQNLMRFQPSTSRGGQQNTTGNGTEATLAPELAPLPGINQNILVSSQGNQMNFGSVRLPENESFMMGDSNIGNSEVMDGSDQDNDVLDFLMNLDAEPSNDVE